MAVNDRTACSTEMACTMIYCYWCTNVGFVNSSASVAPWSACKGVFIQDPSHGKLSTAASPMGLWQRANGLMAYYLQSLAS
ncbi:hypothetical protein TNCV_3658731 [Trichonephila clavipes]|nr:hypothetical protein TNCV_3658731 [Trichonephila clavipes]